MKEYKLIVEESVREFEDELNRLAAQGYQPIGGVSVSVDRIEYCHADKRFSVLVGKDTSKDYPPPGKTFNF